METIGPVFPAEGAECAPEALPPDIYERLVREGFGRAGTIAPIIAGSTLVFGTLSWFRTGSKWLLVWMGLSFVISAFRIGLVLAFFRGAASNLAEWSRLCVLGSWVAAANASLLAVTFVQIHDPMVHALVSVMMFTCVPAGAVSPTRMPPNEGAWQWRLVLTALAAGLAATGDLYYVAIAAMVLLIGITLPIFLRRSYVERIAALLSERENAVLLTQLAAQKAEAEAASRAKSAFLASMSHEFRTPLNAIIGFSELIRMEMFGPIGNTRYRTYLDDIASSGKHLLTLINDVLDMSKIEVGRMELHEEEVDLSDLARTCCESVRLQAAGARVALSLAAAPAIRIQGDPQRLRQILLNLLSNAIKYTREGGQIGVSVSVDPTHACRLIVEDTGIGIAPEHLSTVMEMFGQIESDINRTKAGTGLGLPLTQRLVQMHGGTLQIDSEVGRGTRVTVILPPERTLRASSSADARPSMAAG